MHATRRFGMAIALLVLAGCGKAPEVAPGVAADAPKDDRLREGQRVMLIPPGVGPDGKRSERLGVVTAKSKPFFRMVNSGTEARVVADDGDGDDPERNVMIHVLEGEEKGLTGTVARVSCRPIE